MNHIRFTLKCSENVARAVKKHLFMKLALPPAGGVLCGLSTFCLTGLWAHDFFIFLGRIIFEEGDAFASSFRQI